MGPDILTSVDPGVRYCGVARFDARGELYGAALLPPAGPWTWGGRLVIELPQVYRERKSKGDPNDLIAVAVVVGRIVGVDSWSGLRLVKPRAWKGQAPKSVTERRVRETLSERELEVLAAVDCAKSLLHNVYDAIGLGLWALGRASGRNHAR